MIHLSNSPVVFLVFKQQRDVCHRRRFLLGGTTVELLMYILIIVCAVFKEHFDASNVFFFFTNT